jgi:DNA repair protein RAD50
MNKLLPEYIGVSQAVLDNVIFCHQEDSLWPMSEPSVLKKKFDEIFEALKWTSAMKNINDMQKSQKIELGKFEVRQDLEKVNKDRGDRAQKRSEALDAEIDKLRKDYAVLLQDIKIALQAKEEKWKQATKAFGIVDQLKTKQQRADNLQENIENLKPNLEELQESDEWLQTTLARYDERMTQYEERRDILLSQYQDLQDSLSDSRKKLSNKQTELGQRQAEKETHENKVKSREQLVILAAHNHSLRGYDGDLDEDQVREFIDRVRKLSRDKDRELERIKKATEDELSQIQSKLNDLDNRKTLRTQEKLVARQTIVDNDKKLHLKRREANAIDIDEVHKAELEKTKTDAQNRLRTLNAEFAEAEWDKLLKTESTRQLEVEAESRRLMDELRLSNKLAADRAQLEYVKKQAKETRGKLDTMKSTYSAQLVSLLGSDWQWDNLTHEFQTVVDQRADAVADAKRAQEAAHEQLRELDFKLKQSRLRLTQKKDEFHKRQANVLNSILTDTGAPLANIDDYPRELETLETYCKELQNSLDGMDYVTEYYTKCRDTAVEKMACQLCERAFADKKERSSALEKINRQLEKLKKEHIEGQLMEGKQDLSTAVKARSDYEVCKTLSVEVSGLEKEIRDGDNSKIPQVKLLESHDAKVREEESAQNELADLAAIVKTITEYSNSIAKHDGDISVLSSQHKLSGSSLTTADIDEQQSVCDDRLRALKLRIEKIVNDRDQAKSAIASLEIELGNISNKLNIATHQLEKKSSILADIEEFRKGSIKLDETIQEADADLESLVPQCASANAQYEDARKRGRAKEREVQLEKDKLADTTNKFKLVEDDINRYVEERGPELLAACQQAIKVLEQEQKRIEGEVNQVTADSNEVKKKLDDSDRTRRSIVDNIQYRKYVSALGEVKNEIADLKSRNVTDDYQQLQRQATRADEQYSVLDVKRGAMFATISGKDEELSEAIKLWETDYKDAAQNYREARIKVETTKAAIEDLGKYFKALEAAIMKYHSVKMEEINQIAGELWRQTYQGSDVDTIMIKSENENAASKRAYNYRVVMVKSNAEMDMRGRCSAGQKVLASIVIRLALAECFGVNCGVSSSVLFDRTQLILSRRSLLLTNPRPISMRITSRLWPNLSIRSSRRARPKPTSSSSSSLTMKLSFER